MSLLPEGFRHVTGHQPVRGWEQLLAGASSRLGGSEDTLGKSNIEAKIKDKYELAGLGGVHSVIPAEGTAFSEVPAGVSSTCGGPSVVQYGQSQSVARR